MDVERGAVWCVLGQLMQRGGLWVGGAGHMATVPLTPPWPPPSSCLSLPWCQVYDALRTKLRSARGHISNPSAAAAASGGGGAVAGGGGEASGGEGAGRVGDMDTEAGASRQQGDPPGDEMEGTGDPIEPGDPMNE